MWKSGKLETITSPPTSTLPPSRAIAPPERRRISSVSSLPAFHIKQSYLPAPRLRASALNPILPHSPFLPCFLFSSFPHKIALPLVPVSVFQLSTLKIVLPLGSARPPFLFPPSYFFIQPHRDLALSPLTAFGSLSTCHSPPAPFSCVATFSTIPSVSTIPSRNSVGGSPLIRGAAPDRPPTASP